MEVPLYFKNNFPDPQVTACIGPLLLENGSQTEIRKQLTIHVYNWNEMMVNVKLGRNMRNILFSNNLEKIILSSPDRSRIYDLKSTHRLDALRSTNEL